MRLYMLYEPNPKSPILGIVPPSFCAVDLPWDVCTAGSVVIQLGGNAELWLRRTRKQKQNRKLAERDLRTPNFAVPPPKKKKRRRKNTEYIAPDTRVICENGLTSCNRVFADVDLRA